MRKSEWSRTVLGAAGMLITVTASAASAPKVEHIAKAIEHANYAAVDNLFDGSVETQYCVPKAEDFALELRWDTPQPTQVIEIDQAGWLSSYLWSQISELEVVVNGKEKWVFPLCFLPRAPQYLDLGGDFAISTLTLRALHVDTGEQDCGGLAEIRLLADAPEMRLIQPLRPVVAEVTATPEHTANWHTTGIMTTIAAREPFEVYLDLMTMEGAVFRSRKPIAAGGTRHWTPGDFELLEPGKVELPLRFGAVYRLQLSEPDATGRFAGTFEVDYEQEAGQLFPWERPRRIVQERNGLTWYGGLDRNNCGQFGFRYEPNGLLIGNVSFDRLELEHMTPERNGALLFRIPNGVYSNKEVIFLRDDAKRTGEMINRAGINDQKAYVTAAGAYKNDAIEATWSAVRWRRQVPTADGKRFFQELRYSILSPGIQLETDAPEFLFEPTQGQSATTGTPGLLTMINGILTRFGINDAIPVDAMSENWILFFRGYGEDLPILLALERRPDAAMLTAQGIVLKRAAGIGTVAAGFLPGGSTTIDSSTFAAGGLNLDLLRRQMAVLIAYPWQCEENYAFDADAGIVDIENILTYLPWADDWNTSRQIFTPVPPMVALAIQRGLLPENCVAEPVEDLRLPVKYGPYEAVAADRLHYRLPVPRLWDYAPLDPQMPTHWSGKLAGTLSAAAIERQFGKARDPRTLTPGEYPHSNAFDFSSGAYRAMNFMTPEARTLLQTLAPLWMRGALLPQNYRLRRDPLTGAEYLACTSWTVPDYVENGDNLPDIDYWQGLVLYGFYSQAKYAGQWEAMRRNWPVIRSLLSYWESTNSWALMSPGARESGDMYHSDMPTAGYAGLVGFFRLAEEVGTAEEQALGAYLLAKATVPMLLKYDFFDHLAKLKHRSAQPGALINGFGECFIASCGFTDTNSFNFSERDPWWRTGCIGPLSGQNEVMDLYMGINPRLILWEKSFEAMCPNTEFGARYDETRVMPHVMLRSYQGPEQMASAQALLDAFPGGYLLRDAHIVAGIIGWEIPVRALHWGQALPKHGVWDGTTHTATLEYQSDRAARWHGAIRAEMPRFRVNGEERTAQRLGTDIDGWSEYVVELGPGKSILEIICPKP